MSINYNEKNLESWVPFAREIGSGVVCHVSGKTPETQKFSIQVDKTVNTFGDVEHKTAAVQINLILEGNEAKLFCSFDCSLLENEEKDYIHVNNELSDIIVTQLQSFISKMAASMCCAYNDPVCYKALTENVNTFSIHNYNEVLNFMLWSDLSTNTGANLTQAVMLNGM